jgi:hypothetical protein
MRLVHVLAAAAGALYGYDFGQLIGGAIVGAVLALNAAVFCSILAGGLADSLWRWWVAAAQSQRRSAI